MTADLHDEVRRTLDAAAREVVVPPIDELAFQQHVGTARRNSRARRSTRVAASGAGLVAAGVVAALAISAVTSEQRGPDPGAGPATYAQAKSPTPPAVLVGDDTVIQTQEGTTFTADVDLGRLGPEDAYRVSDGLLVIDRRSTPLRVRITDASATGPFEVQSSQPLAPAVDNLSISADGRTGAWVAIAKGQITFVIYDFVTDKELYSHPMSLYGDSVTIVAVDDNQAMVEVDGQLEIWSADGSREPLALSMDDYQPSGDWYGRVLALPSADRGATDIFSIEGARATRLASVPLGSGALSPRGDNVVGFTPYGVDGPHTPDQDRRYIEIWSADGARRSGFTGLPRTVYEFVWLDNDTVALTGGSGGGTWPGDLDTYTCELEDLVCTKIADDTTGDDDGLPMLAGGRGL